MYKSKILVVDDQELIIYATINILRQQYPEAEIFQAQTSQEAINQVKSIKIDLILVDLAMPEIRGGSVQTETGIQLLKTLMQQYPTLNIVVQSSYPRSLVRLKLAISLHEGGFTVVDKSLPMDEMLTKVEWAIKGVIYTPKEMRSGLEVKPEWLEVLQLAFNEGLQDITIAKRMNKVIKFETMDEQNLSLEHKRSLCRFLEEALCNVGKYAHLTTRLDVTCSQEQGSNIIRVADNGLKDDNGLGDDIIKSHSGFGTQQALSLAKQLGGKFERFANSPQGIVCQLTW